MAVTTTPSSNLLTKLKQDFPGYSFKTDEVCRWSPDSKTIYYASTRGNFNKISLLHEVAHAKLNHQEFKTDIELLEKELQAWMYTRDILGPKYEVDIIEDYIEAALEGYRNWLHQRSTCPNCLQTGLQTKTNTYRCINCRCLWSVNDARVCRLKRLRL